MGIYRDVFDLAAKLGCLEGYLFEQPEEAPRYLPDWLGNIQRMYGSLPPEVRSEFQERYLEILGKASEHLEKLVGPADGNFLQVKQMLAEAGR